MILIDTNKPIIVKETTNQEGGKYEWVLVQPISM